jgi:hypothetical protein
LMAATSVRKLANQRVVAIILPVGRWVPTRKVP